MDEQSALDVKIYPASDPGNKMASTDADLKTMRHELKIMDVEGPTNTVAPIIIEVEDSDMEDTDSHAPVAADEKLLHDPLLDDKDNVSAKTELSSDVESNNSYVDPMGLLERLDNYGDADSQEEEDDFSVDEGTPVSTSHKRSRAGRWIIWMKRWPWLLHEDRDKDYAYCLYCNIKLNVNKRSKYIQQHNLSLYHQERETNYLAFMASQKLNATGEHSTEIKHEIGTSSYVAAMKKKRVREKDAFSEFNWSRWLVMHSWLERTGQQGTIGLCKLCNVKMNVEFEYLRRRHEGTKGHLEAMRSHGITASGQQALKRKRRASTYQAPVPVEEEIDDEEEQAPASRRASTVGTVVGGDVDASKWCELIADTSPQQCRCTLCNSQMVLTSFLRHSKTNAHCQNLHLHLHQNLKGSGTDRGAWSRFSELHPWLVADPEDPNFAYCSICLKRFMYGHSEIKRKNHENSEKHLAAAAANRAALVTVTNNAVEGENQEEQQQQPSEPAPSLALTESERSYGQSQIDEDDDDNWSEAPNRHDAEPSHPWKHTTTRPAPRFYSWLRLSKDRKTQLCRYCRVRFHNESGKARHELSARHNRLVMQQKLSQGMLREAKKQQHRLQQAEGSEEQSNTDSGTVAEKSAEPAIRSVSAIPATMKGKVMVWKERYPWLSYKRSEKRRNYGWCKLCEVSVFLPTSKYASKHQRSTRHVRLRIERKRTGGKPPAAAVMSAAVSAAALTSAEARQKAAMTELQAKYDWLDPDGTDENHCHCRICDTRLPIKVFFLRQHDGSRKHADNLEKYKISDAAASLSSSGPVAEVQADALDLDSDGALSVKSEGSTTGEPPSKRSRRSTEMRHILRALRDSVGKRSDERRQMDMAKDMICSSFDIVTRLRNLERGAGQPQQDSTALAPVSPNVSITSVPPGPRHVMDLFFDSISPTMKALPADLAAEGKAKIMQLVCGLEVRAMQRIVGPPAPAAANGVASNTETVSSDASPNSGADSSSPAHSNSTTITISDQIDEHTAQQNSNEVEKASQQASPMACQTTVSVNGSTKELLSNVRRFLPNSLQVSTRPEDADALRCVPLNKLTTTNSLNGGAETTCTYTPVRSNSPHQTDVNPLAMMRQIRVNNGNQSKMITISKTPTPLVRHSAANSSSIINGGAPIQYYKAVHSGSSSTSSSNSNHNRKSQPLAMSRPSQ
ncbi:protein suppressor of variegation 3-7 isoform X2 [Drosophila guanche]|uniref:protein suppressor of variegation 3-7 isoform X2 n=1 Tax=Drosophila guanche TaxID=7266 RepID=UPI00147173E4|nr:protein suppressor of variegation 3-7 isoform X2 [Drosophila guanche]